MPLYLPCQNVRPCRRSTTLRKGKRVRAGRFTVRTRSLAMSHPGGFRLVHQGILLLVVLVLKCLEESLPGTPA